LDQKQEIIIDTPIMVAIVGEMSDEMSEGKQMVAARGMPALDHWPRRGEAEWRAEESEVLRWMLKQDGIGNWLLAYFQRRGAIRYDGESRKWVGVKVGEGLNAMEAPQDEVEPIAEGRGGRRSKVLKFLKMEMSGMIEDIASRNDGKRAAGRRVRAWGEANGMKLSQETAIRIVKKLLEDGKLIEREEMSKGVTVKRIGKPG